MSKDDRVAIVGLGCRFAGDVDSPESFWNLLLAKENVSGPVPAERWAAYRELSRENSAVLSRVTPNGAFIADIAGFDATAFGISGVEARQLDPQQRMALEVAWEALEHAGIPPADLAGTDTAVFMGVGTDDYGRRLLEDLPGIEAWTGIGASPCGVANRISYTLDLRGPSLAVDTACSSSLVAIHQACASLLSGETPLALAGGVMLMAGPGLTTVLDIAGAIAKDGRSKAFDVAADGYGRGEGCGIVVLKRLTDAVRDGNQVLAVVRGSAVRQDGRTDGIMAPSRPAQEHLLRKAYAASGVDPRDVDYVEAHGTGTRAGDPIEAAALSAVVGSPARPCLIGSVKTNIGHTEAAAGVAGVIKTVLAMRHGVIPATLTVDGPRPDIPWEDSGLRLVTEASPWPETGRARLAGVASYGYGGTIAHVVLEQAPPVEPAHEDAGECVRLYPLSSSTMPGLAAQAGKLADALADQDLVSRGRLASENLDPPTYAPHFPLGTLADVGHTLAHGRSQLPARAVVTAADRAELLAGLSALAEGRSSPAVVAAEAVAGEPVWVFSGHGAQWVGMGRSLLADEPAFAGAVDRLGPIYVEELGILPRRVLTNGDLSSVDVIQAMLFAVQIGLADVWRHYGVRPGAVIGHSVGEIAAAVVAGVLSEEDGARLACRRSALLRGAAGHGAMIMVDRPFDEVADELRDRPDLAAAIAAAPRSTVVAGNVPAVSKIGRTWRQFGHTVREIDSDVAFHSAQMDRLAAELRYAVADLAPSRPTVALYVTALTDPRSAPKQDADYWAANLRNPVRFHQAVQAAIDDGHRTFLEVSAHPVVSHSITETLSANGIDDGFVSPSLRRNKPEQATLLASLAALHCRGARVDWHVLQPGGKLVALPTMAWQHKRHWVDARPREKSPVDTLLGGHTAVHGSRLRVWRTTLDLTTRPYPRRHPVLGTEIVPAAVLLNTFFEAAEGTELTDIRLQLPVVVTDETRELQIVREDTAMRLVSRRVGADDTAWATHSLATAAAPAATDGLGMSEDDCREWLEPDFVVTRLAELGVQDMGYPWHIESLRRGPGMLFARAVAELDRSWAAVLDAALSMASVIFPGPGVLRMPARIAGASIQGPPPRSACLYVRLDPDHPTTVDVEVQAEGSSARLSGLRYAELDGDVTDDQHGSVRYDLAWRPLPMEPPGDRWLAGCPVLVLGSRELASALAGHGAVVSVDRTAMATVDHVLFAPRDGSPHDVAAEFAAMVGEVSALGPGRQPRLWCLTTGLRAGRSTELAPLLGMGRVAASEHPDFFGGVIDMDHVDDPMLPRLLRVRLAEPVLSVHDGEVYAQRLVPVTARGSAPFTCRPDGTYLITGGLGVLGLLIARHLAERGARRIVLLGRTALPPRERWSAEDDRVAAVRRLEACGVTVTTVVADITDSVAVRTALAELDLPPIRGVVHAAGTVDSGLLHTLDRVALRTVMRPKVDGALVLHELFPPGTLDFLVLFSSAGPLLGLPGQGSYAAANSFLDVLSEHRRGSGHRDTVSIAWTSWRGLGMSTSAAATDLELAARGTADIDAGAALRAFDSVLAQPDSGVVAVLRLVRGHTGPRLALLDELTQDETNAPADVPDWVGLFGDELVTHLLGEVRKRVAAVLGMDLTEIGVHRQLTEMGIDSLLASTLRVQLERDLGAPLPATLLWNYPTVADVAGHLARTLSGDQALTS